MPAAGSAGRLPEKSPHAGILVAASVALVLALEAGVHSAASPRGKVLAGEGPAQGQVYDEQVRRDPPGALTTEAPKRTPAENEAILLRQLELQERSARGAVPPGPPGLPHPQGPEAIFVEPTPTQPCMGVE